MKDLFNNIRRQNKPDLSLDRQILERAKTMRAGKKEMLSEKGKERIEMKVSMNKNESTGAAIVRKNHGAIIAAAAAFVLVVGGAAVAAMKGSVPIEPVKESPASSVSESSGDSSSQNEMLEGDLAVTPVSDSSAAPTDEVTVETPQVTTVTKTNEAPMPPSTDSVAEWAKPFLARNSDTVGYIHIPGFDNGEGLNIDFPVVQRSGSEWTYYLSHDFNGDEYSRGTLVAPDDGGTNTISADGQPRNTVIYGYNAFYEPPAANEFYDEAERGLMFTGLNRYQQGIDFYREHALIDYETIYEDSGEYVIFAVFNHDADEDNIFTADAFGNAQHDFDEWLAAVKEHSFVECGINCTAADEYLTLITPVNPENDPNYYRIVIAKKLTADDDKQAIIDSAKMNFGDSEGDLTNEDLKDDRGSEMRIEIPMPEGVRGTYTIDLYKEGKLTYTAAFDHAEQYAGTFVSMDITAKDGDKLDIYVRSDDLDVENYVKYGWIKFTYLENVGFYADSGYDDDAILGITPAE
ncbi:MAG: class B sortase [Ruminococcus sp.]|nr:class B sortase [Ruminococcus sp.]